MRHRLVLLCLAVGLGCTVSPRAPDGAATPGPSTTATATAATEPPAPDAGDPPGDAPVGAACNRHADCAEGICEGEGCGADQGTCAAKQRMCTRDSQIYCGCDGREFRSSGSCPGERFAHRGPCTAPEPKPGGA